MNGNERINFLYQSITDIQGTIRAIDLKVSFVLLILLAPLAVSPNIVESINLHKKDYVFATFTVITTCIWLFNLYISMRALSGIGNPREQISTSTKNPLPVGLFYSGHIFGGAFPDIMVTENRAIKSNVTFEEYSSQVSNLDVEKELTLEQMKLCYIRDLKMIRQHYLFKYASLWICLMVGTMFYKFAITPCPH